MTMFKFDCNFSTCYFLYINKFFMLLDKIYCVIYLIFQTEKFVFFSLKIQSLICTNMNENDTCGRP